MAKQSDDEDNDELDEFDIFLGKTQSLKDSQILPSLVSGYNPDELSDLVSTLDDVENTKSNNDKAN